MILVTGATGLVGSHMLYELTSSGYTVRAIRRKISKIEKVSNTFNCLTNDSQPLLNNIEWVKADINDISSLDKVTEGIDTIYHCAALVSFNKEDKELIYHTNIKGTENIVNICLKKNIRLCFVSSIATMGKVANKNDFITEKSPRDNNSLHSEYSISKYLSEQIVISAINKGLNAIIVNPSIILGSGHWNSGSSLIISTIAKGIKFYTKGYTGFVDVKDVCRAMKMLAESNIKGERFILNQGNYCYKKLFALIAKKLGVKKPAFYAPPFLTGLVWRILFIVQIFTNKKPAITKETSRSSHNISFYSGEKIKKFLPEFEYTNFEETIDRICTCYRIYQTNI